ncbi:MAG: ABC transporter ATPase [Bacteroidota bacterium]|nr:ABC transporter ATPase [Bacteroidota bacterium]
MLVSFHSLPGNSRIWIYQASRLITKSEKETIESSVTTFLESWTAHDATLKAGFEIIYDLFVVIGVDESFNNASGCSIDKQVNFMKVIGEKTDIDFFNRMRISWMQDDQLHQQPLTEFTASINQGSVKGNVIVFNNLVRNMNEFKTSWKQPLQESWIQTVL